MSGNKTKATSASVAAFIKAVENPVRQKDARTIKALMDRVTGWRAKMWGPSIVGYGQYHYRYDSGREGDFFVTGFAPRKANLVVYIMPGYVDYGPLMAKLGKYKTGKSCLYINRLEDVDLKVLERLVAKSVAYMKKKYKVA